MSDLPGPCIEGLHQRADKSKRLTTEGVSRATLTEYENDSDKLDIFIQNVINEIEKANSKDEWVRLGGLLALATDRRNKLNAGGLSHFIYDEQSIEPIPDEIKEGIVVTVTRHEDITWNAPLFIRKHLVDQLNVVDSFIDSDKKILYVTGAPGCGKTCFFLMWAGRLATQKDKRVLFVQYRKNQICEVFVLEDNTVSRLTSPLPDFDNIKQTLTVLLKEQTKKFDVCICDGVRMGDVKGEELMGSLRVQITSGANAKILKLVLVTSLQFHNSLGTEMVGDLGIVRNLSFDSWSEHDYKKAAASELVKDPRIYKVLLSDWKTLIEGPDPEAHVSNLDADQVSELLIQKYHYAGGCARFMFDLKVVQLQEVLKKELDRFRDWPAFTESSMAGSADTAVNILMQRFSAVGETVCTAVSKFVLLYAYQKCRMQLTEVVKTVALETSNRTMEAWAFELKQLDLIRSALEENKRGNGRTAVVNTKLRFVPQAEISFNGKKLAGNVVNGSIIWCLKLNQGCFGVACYFDTMLVTLQFAVASIHSLKLKFLSTLRSELVKRNVVVNRVVHLGIVDNNEDFSFKEPTGTYAATRGNHGSFGVDVLDSSELL